MRMSRFRAHEKSEGEEGGREGERDGGREGGREGGSMKWLLSTSPTPYYSSQYSCSIHKCSRHPVAHTINEFLALWQCGKLLV